MSIRNVKTSRESLHFIERGLGSNKTTVIEFRELHFCRQHSDESSKLYCSGYYFTIFTCQVPGHLVYVCVCFFVLSEKEKFRETVIIKQIN